MTAVVRSSSVGACNAATTISVAKPTGTVDGDVLLAFFSFDTAAGTVSLTGWTNPNLSASGVGQRGDVLGKVASSEPSTITFNNDTTRTGVVILVCIDGSTTDGLDTGTGAPAIAQDSSGTCHTGPSITTTVDDCLILGGFGGDTGSTQNWTTTDTEVDETEESVAWTNQMVSSAVKATAGAVSLSATSGNSLISNNSTVALKPSAATLAQIDPDADNAAGGWTTSPLFSKVNDASDATVITATAS